MCAEIFLLRGVGWLEEEDGLGEEEEGGDVEEGVGGEEDEGVDEYGGPDCGCELWEGVSWLVNGKGRFLWGGRGTNDPDACLGDYGGACVGGEGR